MYGRLFIIIVKENSGDIIEKLRIIFIALFVVMVFKDIVVKNVYNL